jgi:GNAT superfamily N-acetyltransferase
LDERITATRNVVDLAQPEQYRPAVLARIRAFREDDAASLVRWLEPLAPAEDVYSVGGLLHQRRALPHRRRPLWLVALVDGEPVGLGQDGPQVFDGRPTLRRTWVAVRPDLRRRGIGSGLWRRIESHATEAGGLELQTWSAADWPDGQAFALTRGFVPSRRLLQSFIDPRSLDPKQVEHRCAQAQESGFKVSTLAELSVDREPALRRLFLAAGVDSPGHSPGDPVAASTFYRTILKNPTLDRALSTVVFHQDQPVALCWLKGDRQLGKYAVEFTGTLPDWRGRGLATLAKLVALDRARLAGIQWVGTSNDEENGPMLTINRRLGHHPLSDLIIYEHRLPA